MAKSSKQIAEHYLDTSDRHTELAYKTAQSFIDFDRLVTARRENSADISRIEVCRALGKSTIRFTGLLAFEVIRAPIVMQERRVLTTVLGEGHTIEQVQWLAGRVPGIAESNES